MTGLAQPFKRIARPRVGRRNDAYLSAGPYTDHPDYCTAQEKAHTMRALDLLVNDLRTVFAYVSPADKNKNTYSHRLLDLLFRAASNVEASITVVLTCNGYTKSSNLNFGDYKKVIEPLKLGEYRIRLPEWQGNPSWSSTGFAPFDKAGAAPTWWQRYNDAKHDSFGNLDSASLENVVLGVSAALVLTCAQFGAEPLTDLNDAFQNPLYRAGDWNGSPRLPFEMKFPKWEDESLRYDFDHETNPVVPVDFPFQRP